MTPEKLHHRDTKLISLQQDRLHTPSAAPQTYYKGRDSKATEEREGCVQASYWCVCACAHGGHRSNVFSSISPPYVLRQGLSITLEFTNSARLAGQQAPETTGASCHAWFCVDAEDPNLGPNTSMAIKHIITPAIFLALGLDLIIH